MSLAIAFTALAIAGLAAARHLVPALEAQMDGWGAALSVSVILVVFAAYAVAMRLALRAAVPQA
jgi:hypothetical protein